MTVLLDLIDEVSSIKQSLKMAINSKGGNIDIDQNTQDQEIIDNVINTAPWGLDQSVTINWLGQ